ncbi:hypothetical protein IT570_08130 [Candidatus Sumerlaeota bacterium]|nr:hypothetical protein [Candidatus Sumerlaeota bacterium]
MKFLRAIMVLAAVAILPSCTNHHVYRLTDQTYPKTPAAQDVKLYANDVTQPYIMLAYINSFEAYNKTPETRREQLQDLQRRARKVGADAVINVTEMENAIIGFKRDEHTPFPSPEQGEWEETFLRGTAIKYSTKEEAKAARQQLYKEGHIPGIGRKMYEPGESRSALRGIGPQ